MLDEVLQDLVPDSDERERVRAAQESLEHAATAALHDAGIQGEAQVQGSIAKDTWISGLADMDCFLILPQDVAEDRLEDIVTQVAEAVLTSPRKKYAQHPYLIGKRDGFQVDLVPAYRIDSPGQRLSAVDRTPLHTRWVLDHLDPAARDQVRLTKQWCKGIGVYGAETRIGGLSGYLIEVLVHRFGGLDDILDWAIADCTPRRIAIGDDQVDDDVSPLVVVDPVDPTRNCAAAVTAATLDLLQEAAVAMRESPDRRFFYPYPARAEPGQRLHDALDDQDASWTGLILRPQTDRLDLVFPQFQRAARVASEAMEREGFPIRRLRVDALDGDRMVGMQWVTDAITLPETRTHTGPTAGKEPNASRFRAKWDGHPDADGTVLEGDDGHLHVVVRLRERTVDAWLQNHLDTALVGKHVQKALGDPPHVLSDPADVPSEWAPWVADHVLDRRPWQRGTDDD